MYLALISFDLIYSSVLMETSDESIAFVVVDNDDGNGGAH